LNAERRTLNSLISCGAILCSRLEVGRKPRCARLFLVLGSLFFLFFVGLNGV